MTLLKWKNIRKDGESGITEDGPVHARVHSVVAAQHKEWLTFSSTPRKARFIPHTKFYCPLRQNAFDHTSSLLPAGTKGNHNSTCFLKNK